MPTGVPGIEKTLELQQTYGLATVLTVILVMVFLGIFVWVLRWVFKTSAAREASLAKLLDTGMVGITASLNQNTMVCQQIAANLKDGFDLSRKADEYHRADLKDVLSVVSSIERRGK